MSDNEVKIKVTSKDDTGAGFKSAEDHAHKLGGTLAHIGRVGFGALATGAAAAVTGIGAIAVAGGIAGMGFVNMQQRMMISFGALLGSSTKAKAMWNEVVDFAKRTPFELEGVSDAARGLLGVGVAAKDVIPVLTKFGNLSSAYGQSQDEFNRSMLASKQIIGAGKAQWEDLQQIQEAGIPILQLLGTHLHKSLTDVKALASAGKISSKDFMASINDVAGAGKKFSGAMAAQSKTIAGEWSSLKDTFSQTFGQLFIKFAPTIGKAMEGAMPAISKFGDALSKGISKATPVILSVVKAIQTRFIPAMVSIGHWISANVTPKLAELWDMFTSKGLPVLREVYAKALPAAKHAFDQIRKAIADNQPALQEIWVRFKMLAEFVMTKVWPILGPALSTAFKMLGSGTSNAIRAIGLLNHAFDRMVAIFGGAILRMLTLSHALAATMGKLPGPLGAPWRALASAAERGARAVQGVMAAVEQARRSASRPIIFTTYLRTVGEQAHGGGSTLSGGGGRAHGGIIGAESGGARGGLTMVGERGRELVRLPYGSTVIPNGTTENALRGGASRVQVEIVAGNSMPAGLMRELIKALKYEVRLLGGNVQSALGAT